jgi:hypothetical protein
MAAVPSLSESQSSRKDFAASTILYFWEIDNRYAFAALLENDTTFFPLPAGNHLNNALAFGQIGIDRERRAVFKAVSLFRR